MDGHQVRVIVREWGSLKANGSIPHTLDGLIAALNEARDEIPEEYRQSADVDCDPDCSYGDYFEAMEVYYYRPENEEEKATRLAQEKRAAEQRAARARRDLEIAQERLKELG